ncbi:MAG: response regulator, partial [Desulfobacterales bacterium]
MNCDLKLKVLFRDKKISKMPLTTLNLNGSSKSILIVDDDRIIVEVLSVMFNKYGFIVFKAENGLEAWNIFNNENIDVVLTDIRMPGLDSRELSYQIRNQSPFTKIAVMTGEESDVGTELLN